MLDIQLKVFKTVVEKKSFSRAAQELFMTQSSVSQHIHNLENYYGVKLFDRLYRKTALTSAGAALYPYAVEVERLYGQARKTMQGITHVISGRLHIGASLTIGEYLMPRILVAFSRLYPQVDIAMDIFNTEQITLMVTQGAINLGFVEGPFESAEILVAEPCGGDELVIIAPGVSRLDDNVPQSLQELLLERWVMRERNSGTRNIFERFISGHGYNIADLNIVMELGSTQAVKEAVKGGLGIGAISRLTVAEDVKRGDIRVIPVKEGEIGRIFTMLSHRDMFQTSTVEKFSEFMLEWTKKDDNIHL